MPPALVLVVAAVVVVVIVVEQSTLLPHRAAAGSVAGSVAGSSTAATGSGSPLAAQPPSARQVLDAKPVAALEAAARRPRPRGRTCTRRRPVEAVATASPPGDHETLLVTPGRRKRTIAPVSPPMTVPSRRPDQDGGARRRARVDRP